MRMNILVRPIPFVGAVSLALLAAAAIPPAFLSASPPPAGFVALFNEKDLSGWRGGDTFDHRKLLEMPAGMEIAG